MKIRDIRGESLTLTKTHLKEDVGSIISKVRYQVSLSAIKSEYENNSEIIAITSVNPEIARENGMVVKGSHFLFSRGFRKIGCRTFGVDSWDKILKAAGIRVSKTVRG